jgi:O-antigen ligase
MLLVTLILILLQFLLAMLAPMRFIYLSLWVQTIPYTWNFDSQLVYDTPIGPLNVVAMQMFGFTLACLLALLFHAKGTAEQFKYVRWHAAFIGFCVLSIIYGPSVSYALRMIAKLLGPFMFMMLVLVVVRSDDEVRKMRTAILGSGMILVALALLARAAGIVSDPNAVQTGMSGLGPPSMGPPVFSAHMLPVAMLALATFLVERRALMLVITVTSALAVLGALQRTSAGALYLGFSLIMFAGTRGVWRLLLPVTGLLGLPALMVFSDAFRRRMFFGDATSQELLSDPQKAANSINGSGRFDLWDAVLRRFFDPNPVFGSGIGSTQEFFYTRFGAGVVHSEYVRLLCEVGLLGLTLFLLALASYLWRMRGNWRRAASPGSRLSGLAAMGGIICYAVYCATDNSFDYVVQFGIYVFGMVAIAIKASELPSTARQAEESAIPAAPFPNLMR